MSNDGKTKLGRKFKDDESGEMDRIALRVDKETMAALNRLIAREPGDIRGRRSIIIRRLILSADEQARRKT